MASACVQVQLGSAAKNTSELKLAEEKVQALSMQNKTLSRNANNLQRKLTKALSEKDSLIAENEELSTKYALAQNAKSSEAQRVERFRYHDESKSHQSLQNEVARLKADVEHLQSRNSELERHLQHTEVALSSALEIPVTPTSLNDTIEAFEHHVVTDEVDLSAYVTSRRKAAYFRRLLRFSMLLSGRVIKTKRHLLEEVRQYSLKLKNLDLVIRHTSDLEEQVFTSSIRICYQG